MNHSQESFEMPDTKRGKAQFSISKMMLWAAIFAGGMAIVAGGNARADASLWPDGWVWIVTGFFLSNYAIFVCGIWAHVKHRKAFDVMLPTGMHVLYLVTYFVTVLEFRDVSALFCYCLLLALPPCGIFLIVLNVRRIKRRKFSRLILVYQLAFLLFWTTLFGLIYLLLQGNLAAA